ncbi:hypothetical protein RESH_01400 [Rhodopirellula europaea SH398]|uniref:Uncharacterized protein n=1 Tax=Rhodopirellula europaea SH398 TaxID=1263868 RepID=M5S923_9BACT|nr:hypothetical protein RESH_01400 [Rhodopirellula europaea SH398]
MRTRIRHAAMIARTPDLGIAKLSPNQNADVAGPVVRGQGGS